MGPSGVYRDVDIDPDQVNKGRSIDADWESVLEDCGRCCWWLNIGDKFCGGTTDDDDDDDDNDSSIVDEEQGVRGLSSRKAVVVSS